MKLLGFEVTRAKERNLSAVAGGGSWFRIIGETFAGAWQRVMPVDAPRDLLAFSAVYACVTMIASDVAKLRIKMIEEGDDGICTEVTKDSPYLPVLRKPNRYQNRIKFVEQWIVSKLIHGNAYALKQRDQRGIVVALYLLDPQRVKVLVSEDGGVYYELSQDNLSGVGGTITVPAAEIIHDMMVSLWHPLVGVSPIYACGMSATQGNRIQQNSTRFFANMSRPSGGLTAPGTISDETAARLKTTFEQNFSGENIGRMFVAGDGLKYEPWTIPAQDAQLIEQLKWTVEDVARCFHVPMYKLGGQLPVRASVESDQQTYYTDCLQSLLESMEACLDEGLGLSPKGYATEFDLKGLLRMDTAARYETYNAAVKGGWMKPDEARAEENLAPVPGGNQCYLQQQNYSLEALAKRDASAYPFAAAKIAPAVPAPDAAAKAAAEAAAFLERIVKGLACET